MYDNIRVCVCMYARRICPQDCLLPKMSFEAHLQICWDRRFPPVFPGQAQDLQAKRLIF